jgi:hypothetical protein
MNRLTAIKLMGASLLGALLNPLALFGKPDQAELDTQELERIAASGESIRNRTFLVKRTITFRDNDIRNCKFIAAPGFEGVVVALDGKGKGAFKFNEIKGNPKSIVLLRYY